MVLSDGLPFDERYEDDSARADSRRALSEARLSGVGAACISAAPSTADTDLERVFGSVPHIVLQSYGDLPAYVGSTVLTALREVRSQQRREPHESTAATRRGLSR